MAASVKYNKFTENLASGVHLLTSDVLKVMLSNSTPNVSTHTVRADASEITAGNGYTTGGKTATASLSRTSGVTSIVGVTVVFTAAGGTIGPFRYAILYDDTPTSPADPLICSWDYGSALTLQDGDSHAVVFGTEMFTIT